MVNPNLLLKTLKENKIDTFCGVADSVLKKFFLTKLRTTVL